MALDLPLPKNLLAHGHWTMDKFKMSKSRGNVANPFEAMKLWGTDAMRVYLMKAGGNSAVDAGKCDGRWSWDTALNSVGLLHVDYSASEIEGFYKKSLAGQMGNLLARISNKKLIQKLPSPEAFYTAPVERNSEDDEIREVLEALPGESSENKACAFLAGVDINESIALTMQQRTLSTWTHSKSIAL